MEENNAIKIANVMNLPPLNIKSQLNINIDSNTNIKQILNIETNLIDSQIEPMFNKAVIKGTVGVKVVYIDTDNMYNTISNSTSFSESINMEGISADCQIDIYTYQFLPEFSNDGKVLRINLDGIIECFCTLNSNLNLFNQNNDNLVIKKSILQTYSCVQKINKNSPYNYNFKLDTAINKLLSCDSKVIVDEIKCCDGYILVTGQMINTMLYESSNSNNNLQSYNNSSPFKCEFEASQCDIDCVADVSVIVDINNTQISTDIGDNFTKFDIEYSLNAYGYVYKVVNADIVEDVYSTHNEIEIINNSYSLCKKLPYFKSMENIDAEITLADELNIEQILGMINTSSTITQSAVKESGIMIEGVINGNVLYVDESGETKQLPTQLPYSINIKQEISGKVCATRINATPITCRCKIKRGNTLSIDYEMCVSGNLYTQTEINLIDNIKYGKAINYGDIAFQIYVAHPNESSWDLCKRIHISQEKLALYNKENPATYNGGEKIIVYR